MSKVWFITGSSGGLGRALAEAVAVAVILGIAGAPDGLLSLPLGNNALAVLRRAYTSCT